MDHARHIRAALIARGSGKDAVVLASHLHWNRELHGRTLEDFVATTLAILQSSGWHGFLESGQSSVHLKENDHAFVMFVDHNQVVFVVVVTESYPARYIFAADGSGMIDEMRKLVDDSGEPVARLKPDGLQRPIGSQLSKLCIKYDDLESLDKVIAAQAKVREVADTMTDVIHEMLQRGDRTDDLLHRSEALLGQAKTYENSTTELKNTMRCRYWMVRLSAIALVVAIVLVVVLVLYFMHKF